MKRTQNKPDFLGIGAPRSGTSWLHTQLCNHPELWLPLVKELHYFDVECPYISKFYEDTKNKVAQVRSKYYYRRRHSMFILKSLISDLICGQFEFEKLKWGMRYVSGKRNDDWYRSLFKSDKISGEITPAYMTLPAGMVKAIHSINPELKIILILRNPIDREWSGVRKFLLRGKQLDRRLKKRIIQRFSHITLRSNYVIALRKWQHVFGEDQIFIGFFDQIAIDPVGFLKEIYVFLQVSMPPKELYAECKKKINASRYMAMPEDIAKQLSKTYINELKHLSDQFGGYAHAWLRKTEEILGC
jgi:hypothetical protein